MKATTKHSASRLTLPGTRTRTGWQIPEGLTFNEWVDFGRSLTEIDGSVQWWLGDWWAYGEHEYGGRRAATEPGGVLEGLNFQTAQNYGTVAKAVETSRRREVLSFSHHAEVASLTPAQQEAWLNRAETDRLSVSKLRLAIRQEAAIARTAAVEFDAAALGKYAVLYADPPWRYESGTTDGDRAIENHYPTLPLEEICALPVSDIAHDNAVLFLWATAPKLAEAMQVISAWGFSYRTEMIWLKDKIGMGYHVRAKHEPLLIAKRGVLPPPPTEARPESVVQAPRREHSAKPPKFYDLIDAMYPGVHKIELFARAPAARPFWSVWGNQALSRMQEVAA
jgi:N6-adenosine-specific RNA methylase IME4